MMFVMPWETSVLRASDCGVELVWPEDSMEGICYNLVLFLVLDDLSVYFGYL